jgi:hypothetical protein
MKKSGMLISCMPPDSAELKETHAVLALPDVNRKITWVIAREIMRHAELVLKVWRDQVATPGHRLGEGITYLN